MSEGNTEGENVIAFSLTQSEIDRAKLGSTDFAKALDRANLKQLFLLTGAGSYSQAIQTIYIGAKPVFADDFNQILPRFSNLFPKERFQVVNDFIYDPELVKDIIGKNGEVFGNVFPNPFSITDDNLRVYMERLSTPHWEDPNFDRKSHDRELGILLGIPKEDVEAYTKNSGPALYTFSKTHSKNKELNKKVRRAFNTLSRNGFDLGALSGENKQEVIAFLETEFPKSFVDYLCARKSVYYGLFQYVTVTNSGDSVKRRLDQFFAVSGIDNYLSAKYLFPLVVRKIKSNFGRKIQT